MSEHGYVHSVEQDEVELERLKLQEDTIDPPTIRHLETIGVSQGWKCLEVGAGAGSIAQWLSNRVGPTGKAVATDIDTLYTFPYRWRALPPCGHRDSFSHSHM